MTGPAQVNSRWLSIIGIGEDGVDGLAPAARTLLSAATAVYGGKRHLDLAAPLIRGEAHPWPSPLTDALPDILARRGEPVAVLASGDPYLYGVGTLLTRHVPADEITALPAPSTFSLACARLGWSLADTATLTCCGRPVEGIAPHLQPGRRLLVLSADETTPAALADYLSERGFGASHMIVLEALGGASERIRETAAEAFGLNDIHPLNLVAVETVAGPDAIVLPLATGLDDALFEHDGQLTKREVRAVTLSALAPRIGERLWDIGCGSGSVAIEWLLRHPANTAIGIERAPDRAARAARNAAHLGVPRLKIVEAEAPAGLAGLARPDAVFIGGGGREGTIETAWDALAEGGRMVVNSVTLETDAALTAAHGRHGGTLTRISIERLDRIGGLHGFRPAMTVTQWTAMKR